MLNEFSQYRDAIANETYLIITNYTIWKCKITFLKQILS